MKNKYLTLVLLGLVLSTSIFAKNNQKNGEILNIDRGEVVLVPNGCKSEGITLDCYAILLENVSISNELYESTKVERLLLYPVSADKNASSEVLSAILSRFDSSKNNSDNIEITKFTYVDDYQIKLASITNDENDKDIDVTIGGLSISIPRKSAHNGSAGFQIRNVMNIGIQ